MNRDLTIDDIQFCISYALHSEYGHDFKVTDLKIISKWPNDDFTEVAVKCSVDDVESFFDIFYDNIFVGVDWHFNDIETKKLMIPDED